MKRSLTGPLILITVYLVVFLLARGALPSYDQIIADFASIYHRFGYEIIFVGAFLEAALVIDLFVPGASIVLLGAVFARTGQIQFPLYLMSASLGFTLGFFVDYLLGYYGASDILLNLGLGKQLDEAKKKVQKHGGKAFLLGYFHPDLATLFATASGIIKLDLKEFFVYNFLAGSLWLLFWSSLAYLFGLELIQIIRQYFLIGIVLIFAVWLAFRWGFKSYVHT